MNRIKELRQKKKITQEELARILGVKKLTVSRWERGESQIKQDRTCKLAEYFNVSVGYLLGYTDKEQEKKMDNEKQRENDEISKNVLKASIATISGIIERLKEEGKPLSEEQESILENIQMSLTLDLALKIVSEVIEGL